jgi:hypothetical protein
MAGNGHKSVSRKYDMWNLAKRATVPARALRTTTRTASSKKQRASQSERLQGGDRSAEEKAIHTSKQQKSTKKTSLQMDDEMRRAMEGLAGDGGEAGLELEDGKAVSMKRGVRENMFRYI